MNASGGGAPRMTATAGASASETAGDEPRPCPYVRDFARANGVYPEIDIQRLSRHAAHCLTCMEEFVRLVGSATS